MTLKIQPLSHSSHTSSAQWSRVAGVHAGQHVKHARHRRKLCRTTWLQLSLVYLNILSSTRFRLCPEKETPCCDGLALEDVRTNWYFPVNPGDRQGCWCECLLLYVLTTWH